jgi:hypothetical protein
VDIVPFLLLEGVSAILNNIMIISSQGWGGLLLSGSGCRQLRGLTASAGSREEGQRREMPYIFFFWPFFLKFLGFFPAVIL